MSKVNLYKKSLKTMGLVRLNSDSVDVINKGEYRSYIKALYVPKGSEIRVDFNLYKTKQQTLFFISPNQYLEINSIGTGVGYFIFYNRDFYCIQIHDEEVACDGLLFNNVHNMPMINVSKDEAGFIDYLFKQMEEEYELTDTSLEEMIRTYLKQLLIKATRLWKKQHLDKEVVQQSSDLEFFRKFTLLVDHHYKQKHTVADYADLLFIASKTITHKFKRLNLPQPNEVIKNRIVLEAKRLLVHTTLTAKEIAHELGYEDPAYFSRLFLVKTGASPSGFRTKYHTDVEG